MTMTDGFERYLESALPGGCPEGFRLVLFGAWVAGAAQACHMVNLAQSPADLVRVYSDVNQAAAAMLASSVDVEVVSGQQARRH